MTRLRPATMAIMGAALLALGLVLLFTSGLFLSEPVQEQWSFAIRLPFIVGVVMLSMSIRLRMQERREIREVVRRNEQDEAESDAGRS